MSSHLRMGTSIQNMKNTILKQYDIDISDHLYNTYEDIGGYYRLNWDVLNQLNEQFEVQKP